MAKRKIILIGGGGHCRSCIDVIESTGEYKITGIVDENLQEGTLVMNYPVIGDDRMLAEISDKVDFAIVTIGQEHSSEKRKHLFNNLKALGFKVPAIGADRSYVSKHASVGIGSMIFHHAMINAKVKIGMNCIINTNALIEHDVIVGSHSHIAPSATLNGSAQIGEECFVGSNAVILHNISICNNVKIGAGAVVIKNIDQPGTYVGIPARKVR